MDDSDTGLATGALLLLVGVWVVSRTVVHDSSGHNLIDRIVAYASGNPAGGKSGGKSPGVGLNTNPLSVHPPVDVGGGGLTITPNVLGVGPDFTVPIPDLIP